MTLANQAAHAWEREVKGKSLNLVSPLACERCCGKCLLRGIFLWPGLLSSAKESVD